MDESTKQDRPLDNQSGVGFVSNDKYINNLCYNCPIIQKCDKTYCKK